MARLQAPASSREVQLRCTADSRRSTLSARSDTALVIGPSRSQRTSRRGEDGLIVDLTLDPGHEQINVLAGGNAHRLRNGHAVRPQVLVLRPRRHGGARLWGAKVDDCTPT